jgi:hypothetical protein
MVVIYLPTKYREFYKLLSLIHECFVTTMDSLFSYYVQHCPLSVVYLIRHCYSH